MKYLATIITLHGLGYIYQSILDFSSGKIFKIGTSILSPNYHKIGIILGLLLVIDGIGMWFSKKYSYYLTIIIFSTLIVYATIAVIYITITSEVKDLLLLILVVFISFLFYLIIRYTKRNKSLFE